jgi:hypothetical protein
MEDVNQVCVEHGAIHVLSVPKGKVAKVFQDNLPRLLGYGFHFIESVNFEYKGLSDLKDRIISHGTITMVQVNLGEIGVAWDKNEPFFH